MKVSIGVVAFLPIVSSSPALSHGHLRELRRNDNHLSPRESIPANKRAPQISWGSPMNYWLAILNAIASEYYNTPSTISMTPTDDSGRSQMLDDSPNKTCAGVLICSQCPNDPRCFGSSSAESAPTPGVVAPLYKTIVAGQPSAAPSSPSLPSTSITSISTKGLCPLQKCGAGPNGGCGSNTRCLKGYCACPFALKARPDKGSMVRYGDSLGEMSVYVNPGMKCEASCDTLFCDEVQTVSSCFAPPTTKLLTARQEQNEPMSNMNFFELVHDGEDDVDDNGPWDGDDDGHSPAALGTQHMEDFSSGIRNKLKGAKGVLLCDERM